MVSRPFAIRCQQLIKRYGSVLALDRLDLSVYAGECFGLLGPNGAGKTTAMEILAGLLKPTSGEVEVLGRRWASDAGELKERVGIALQETQLPDRLKVAEVLRLFRSFYRRGASVDDVAELVGLTEQRDVWYERLSGGQKQRVAVACALMGDPELLILDEPTTGLDPQARRQMWELLHRFRTHGQTVLLTTHYLEEAERLCDRVAIVDHGRLLALGTPNELIAGLSGTCVVELAASHDVDESALSALPGVQSVQHDSNGYSLTVTDMHVSVEALFSFMASAGARVDRLTSRRATLEDVFIHLTGRPLRD